MIFNATGPVFLLTEFPWQIDNCNVYVDKYGGRSSGKGVLTEGVPHKLRADGDVGLGRCQLLLRVLHSQRVQESARHLLPACQHINNFISENCPSAADFLTCPEAVLYIHWQQ